MTKFDLSKIQPIPGFNSLKWKREVHAKIYRETEGMTPEAIREYFQKGAERCDADIAQRRAELAANTPK